MNRISAFFLELTGKSRAHCFSFDNSHVTINIGASRVLKRVKAVSKEMELVARIQDEVGPDTVVFDIGANIGLISLLLACDNSAVKPAVIHSFEPESKNFSELNKNIALNNKQNAVVPHKLALSDSTGKVMLYTFAAVGDGRHSISTDRKSTNSESVPSMRAIDFCNERGAFPDIVKIDVEGAEGLVLSGMEELVSTRPPKHFFIEVHAKGGADCMPDGTKIGDWFNSHNYRQVWTHHTRRTDEHRHYVLKT